MTSSRSPDIKYNGSGYVDKTAYDAISKVDRESLKIRRRRVIDKINEIAESEGLRINSYISLVEVNNDN